MHLALGLIFPGASEEPVTVVAGNLAGLDVKARQLPVRSHLLKDQGKHGPSLRRIGVEEIHAILACGKIIEVEDGAVGGLTTLTKNSAVKLGVRGGSRAVEQKDAFHGRLGSRKIPFVVFHGGLDPAEVGSQAGYGILTHGCNVAPGGQTEIALAG